MKKRKGIRSKKSIKSKKQYYAGKIVRKEKVKKPNVTLTDRDYDKAERRMDRYNPVDMDKDNIPDILLTKRESELLANRKTEGRNITDKGRVSKSQENVTTATGYKMSEDISKMVRKYKKLAEAPAEKKYEDMKDELHLERVISNAGYPQDAYELSERLDRDDWRRIASYMEKRYEWDNDYDEGSMRFAGWKVRKGEEDKVEKILGIKVSRFDIEKAEEEAEKESRLRRELSDSLEAELKKIPFEYIPSKEQLILRGKRYYVSKRALIYGGGSWYVIGDDGKIWYVVNNGTDGGDWSYNNVKTGGAGAIGKAIEYNDDVATLIKTLYKEERR